MEDEQRSDLLTAQKIDVGLILQEMLGIEEAEVFLIKNRIKPSVINRVLRSMARRSRASDSRACVKVNKH